MPTHEYVDHLRAFLNELVVIAHDEKAFLQIVVSKAATI